MAFVVEVADSPNAPAHRRRAKDARMEHQRNRGVRVEPSCSVSSQFLPCVLRCESLHVWIPLPELCFRQRSGDGLLGDIDDHPAVRVAPICGISFSEDEAVGPADLLHRTFNAAAPKPLDAGLLQVVVATLKELEAIGPAYLALGLIAARPTNKNDKNSKAPHSITPNDQAHRPPPTAVAGSESSAREIRDMRNRAAWRRFVWSSWFGFRCISDQNLNDVSPLQSYGWDKQRSRRPTSVDSLHDEFMEGYLVAVSIVMLNGAHHRKQFVMIAADGNRLAVQRQSMCVHAKAERPADR